MINYVLKENRPPIDLQIYDIELCFDKLDLKEALNVFWDSGVQNEYFALLYELNKKIDILIKSSVGKTRREAVDEIIAQGGIFGGLQCSNLIDTIGKECLKTGENVYLYKYKVYVLHNMLTCCTSVYVAETPLQIQSICTPQHVDMLYFSVCSGNSLTNTKYMYSTSC